MPLFDKVRNTDEAEIKRRAEEFQSKYGQGQSAEEPGIEEGDLADYVLPMQGLGKNILKAVAEKSLEGAGKALTKEAVKEGANKAKQSIFRYVKEKVKKLPEVEGPDYKNENIAFRPTTPPKQEGWERFNFGKKP